MSRVQEPQTSLNKFLAVWSCWLEVQEIAGFEPWHFLSILLSNSWVSSNHSVSFFLTQPTKRERERERERESVRFGSSRVRRRVPDRVPCPGLVRLPRAGGRVGRPAEPPSGAVALPSGLRLAVLPHCARDESTSRVVAVDESSREGESGHVLFCPSVVCLFVLFCVDGGYGAGLIFVTPWQTWQTKGSSRMWVARGLFFKDSQGSRDVRSREHVELDLYGYDVH